MALTVFSCRIAIAAFLRGLTERPHDGAPRQADLEIVVSVAFGAAQHDVSGLRKYACVGALAAQDGFGGGDCAMACVRRRRAPGGHP